MVCSVDVDWVLIFRSGRADLGERSKRGSRRVSLEIERGREREKIVGYGWSENFLGVANLLYCIVLIVK